MSELAFIWDPRKAKTNLLKHRVSFEEARSVFYDEHAIEFFDDTEEDGEERFLMLGLSVKRRLLLVCHCYREPEDTIRIISARKATKTESEYYRR